jgi:hypothetical protein
MSSCLLSFEGIALSSKTPDLISEPTPIWRTGISDFKSSLLPFSLRERPPHNQPGRFMTGKKQQMAERFGVIVFISRAFKATMSYHRELTILSDNQINLISTRP